MLTCHLVRILRDLTDDREVPTAGWAARHVASCDRCRADVEAIASLARRLQQSASTNRPTAPPLLEARVVAAVKTRSAVAPTFGPWLRLALGLAAVFAVSWLAFQYGPGTVGVRAPQRESSLTASLVLSPSFTSKLRDGTKLLASGKALDAPLERELGFVVSDARSAARALTTAFLPQGMVQPERFMRLVPAADAQ